MYVMGTVRDLSSELKTVMETTMSNHGVTKETAGRARLLAEHVIREPLLECRHALIAMRVDFLTKRDGNIGMEMVTYQYMELVARMIYLDDVMRMDKGNLILLL